MLMMPRKITELLRGFFKSLANFATLNKLHGLESFLCNINVVNRFWFFFTLFVCFKLHLAAVLLLTVQVFVAIFLRFLDMIINHPSSGGPRYTIDTSVFPYTADTEGYKRLSGKPKITRLKNSRKIGKLYFSYL